MATFDTKVIKNKFESNIVIRVGSTYFSQKKPDSGLLIDENLVGLVLDANLNTATIDMQKSKTSIPTFSFSLLDKDGIVTGLILTEDDAWIGTEVKCWIGFINCSMSFTGYKILSTTRVTNISKSANEYKITCSGSLDLLQKAIHQTVAYLSADLTDIGTTLNVDSTAGFTNSGFLYVNGEFIEYSSKTDTTFVSSAGGRAAYDSEASSHGIGSPCYLVKTYTDHAIDILIDIFENDLEIPADMFLKTTFESIRDNQLATDGDVSFMAFNTKNALTFIEEHILFPNNLRLINIDGVIALTIIDQNTLYDNIISENEIHGLPSYNIDGNKIVNTIHAKYDYNYGRAAYQKTDIHINEESVLLFGEKKLELEFKGIYSSAGGEVKIKNRCDRLLARFSFPQATIDVSTHLNKFNIKPSDIVQITHRYLPRRGVGLDIRDILEVMSVGLSNLKSNPTIKFKLEYTSFGNYRFGLISPSPTFTSITSQSVFEVPDGSLYEVGFALRLFDITTGEYCADAVNIIQSIDGNEITMTDAWTTVLSTDLRLFFALYEDCSANQKNDYCFISPDENIFSDARQAYRISF